MSTVRLRVDLTLQRQEGPRLAAADVEEEAKAAVEGALDGLVVEVEDSLYEVSNAMVRSLAEEPSR